MSSASSNFLSNDSDLSQTSQSSLPYISRSQWPALGGRPLLETRFGWRMRSRLQLKLQHNIVKDIKKQYNEARAHKYKLRDLYHLITDTDSPLPNNLHWKILAARPLQKFATEKQGRTARRTESVDKLLAKCQRVCMESSCEFSTPVRTVAKSMSSPVPMEQYYVCEGADLKHRYPAVQCSSDSTTASDAHCAEQDGDEVLSAVSSTHRV